MDNKLKAYPIKLENNDFPSGQDKAEAFVNLFAENSLSSNPVFEEKRYSGHIFFYVKKAYDSVWHARLLYKLKNIGITGMMFQYF